MTSIIISRLHTFSHDNVDVTYCDLLVSNILPYSVKGNRLFLLKVECCVFAAQATYKRFPETHDTTSCIKLSLQWFIIMNHENSQPVQCLWVSPLHTNIHSHTKIIKKRQSWVQKRKKWKCYSHRNIQPCQEERSYLQPYFQKWDGSNLYQRRKEKKRLFTTCSWWKLE